MQDRPVRRGKDPDRQVQTEPVLSGGLVRCAPRHVDDVAGFERERSQPVDLPGLGSLDLHDEDLVGVAVSCQGRGPRRGEIAVGLHGMSRLSLECARTNRPIGGHECWRLCSTTVAPSATNCMTRDTSTTSSTSTPPRRSDAPYSSNGTGDPARTRRIIGRRAGAATNCSTTSTSSRSRNESAPRRSIGAAPQWSLANIVG